MKATKEYTHNNHRVKITIEYPLANFDVGTPASVDACQARLVATVDNNPFQTLEDDLTTVQARATSIVADINTTIDTYETQAAIAVGAFQTAIVSAGYTVAQN